MTAPRLGPGLWTARAMRGSIRPQPLPPSYTTTGDTNAWCVRTLWHRMAHALQCFVSSRTAVCRVSSGLSVLMPAEASTVGVDQSMEELRRELAEAREQQAATAGILAAISNSPTDAHGVFAEIAASAARLCDGYNAGIFQLDGDLLRLVAHQGPIPALGPVGHGTLPLTRGLPPARAVLDRQTLHVADLQAETTEYPEGSEFARRLGFRAALSAPLLRAGEAIGVITIRRTDARPFTDRQIALLKTFADQAVIAIENTRLFEEVQARTRELSNSLEQQTATSEILQVVSDSLNDTQPVFDAIVQSGLKLFPGALVSVALRYGAAINAAAVAAPGSGSRRSLGDAQFPVPPSRGITCTAQPCLIAGSWIFPMWRMPRRSSRREPKLPDQRQPRNHDHAHDARR